MSPMTRFLLRWLTPHLARRMAPFACLLVGLGVCWLIDLLDRMGALGQ